MSPDMRSIRIRTKLLPVSGLPALTDPSTPQYASAQWLIDDDARYLCPEDPTLIQRYILAVIYFSTEGAGWKNCSAVEYAAVSPCLSVEIDQPNNARRYLSAASECSWYGNHCSDEVATINSTYNAIDEVDLRANNLVGTIPFEFPSLPMLRELWFSSNSLVSSIPSSLGELSLLRRLDLGRNDLSGVLPKEIYRLGLLTALDAMSNKLSGTLDTDIGRLRSIRRARLQDNLLDGTVPTEIGQLENLELLLLHRNNLQGSMPAEVCSLRNTSLQDLTADCAPPPESPELECTCCTICFSDPSNKNGIRRRKRGGLKRVKR